MSLDSGTFESLVPYRFITFTFPNPSYSVNSNTYHLHTPLLRVAVLDSPIQPTTTNSPGVAAMLVPEHRETDWIFSTEAGHLQLLLSSPEISRLILLGNLPASNSLPETYHRPISVDPMHAAKLEDSLTPLLVALLPKSAFLKNGFPEIPFLSYEDDVISSVILEKCVGSCVGEMLVEDVELEGGGGSQFDTEFRRRLRFKRMPNLIQTQIRIVQNRSADESGGSNFLALGGTEFGPDLGALVHPYLTPMVAGLSLITPYLDERFQGGFRPKALCLGVGGGALLGFLSTQLGFEVVGVEADAVVLRVARQFFGLDDGEFIKVCIGDGIELLKELAHHAERQNSISSDAQRVENGCWLHNVAGIDTKFDVIMVDLDSNDARRGISAPSLEFVGKSVILAARLVLCDFGVLVINVIPPTRSFYEKLMHEVKEVFLELFEIDVGNGENFVLIASASHIVTASSDSENSFFAKLKLVISGAYIGSIRKI